MSFALSRLRAADRWCEAQLTGWEVELFEADPVAQSDDVDAFAVEHHPTERAHPDKLIAAGIHSPTRTSSTEKNLLWLVLMKCSTYSTQPTAIAALPAHAVIQRDHELAKPSRVRRLVGRTRRARRQLAGAATVRRTAALAPALPPW